MNKDNEQKNYVELIGSIRNPLEFSHDVYGEKFYKTILSVIRSSGVEDLIPMFISERILDVDMLQEGMRIGVIGQFRSSNIRKDERSSVVLAVFVDKIFLESTEGLRDNYIRLDGYMCKKPVYRITPLGREITDLLIAVNRSYGKSDYIPCVCWGRNARYATRQNVGTRMKLSGRIQSRDYVKTYSDGMCEERTVYEFSINTMEVVVDEN